MNEFSFVPMVEDNEEPDRTSISREGEIACLRDALDALMTKNEFKVKMIVRQKPACKGYKSYSDNGLAIVVELLDEPIIRVDVDSTSGHYRESMDMIVGEWDANQGVFVTFHVDSRRHEPVEDV